MATGAAADTSPPTGGVFEYLDEMPRTYQFWDGTVLTPCRGDVCRLPYDPLDGRWQPSKKKANRPPDNHPDQAQATSKAQAEARAQVHADAAAALADQVAASRATPADGSASSTTTDAGVTK